MDPDLSAEHRREVGPIGSYTVVGVMAMFQRHTLQRTEKQQSGSLRLRR